MKASKLLLILQSFPKTSETFIVRKFIGLYNQGWNIHIICQHRGDWDNFPELTRIENIKNKVHRCWPHRPKWLAAFLVPISLLRCLLANSDGTVRYLRRGWCQWKWEVFRNIYLDTEIICQKPDIIHFEFGALAVGRMYLKDLLNCSILISFRGYDLNFSGLDEPHYYKEVWEKSTIIHLLSENLWKKAQERGCPNSKPHILIPPALDLENYPEIDRQPECIGLDGRPIKILSVGRLEPKKGYIYAIQIIRILTNKGYVVEYRLIGAGTQQAEIIDEIRNLKLEVNITLKGAISHSEVIENLIWADIFLHPSLSEGFCNAVIEAQAMKLPVICSDVGALPENIENGQTGFLFPPKDPAYAADKIIFLARNTETRLSMGREGRKRVQQKFKIENQIDAFDCLYQEMMDQETLN